MRRRHLPVPVYDLRVGVVVSADGGDSVGVHESTDRVPTLDRNNENGIKYDSCEDEPSQRREGRVPLHNLRR
jgi:hypothetical protein